MQKILQNSENTKWPANSDAMKHLIKHIFENMTNAALEELI